MVMIIIKKALPVICLLLLAACGYRMVGKETHVPPGLNSVAVPTFKNRTFEPGIEVPFTQAFLNEFILDKRVNVVNRAQADSVLEGFITDFKIYSVSYDRSGFVLEYQTNITLDVTLKDRTGKVLWEEKNFSETQWFRASFDVLINEANKNAAVRRSEDLLQSGSETVSFKIFDGIKVLPPAVAWSRHAHPPGGGKEGKGK